jgi:hypothetical protein
MSALLFVVGAIAVVAGAVMIGFGFPVKEFSFGNTLIISGITALAGGLIVIGLGAVVMQLQRVVEALASRPPLRTSRPMEPFEQPTRAGAAAGRVPFPAKPKADAPREQRAFVAGPTEMPAEPAHEAPHDMGHEMAHDLAHDLSHDLQHADMGARSAAPTLRNPDDAQVAVEESDELSLSPRQHPMFAATHAPAPAAPAPTAEFNEPFTAPPLAVNGSDSAEKRAAPALDAGWRTPPAPPPQRQPQTSYFDSMWPAAETRPAESHPAKPPAAPAAAEAKPSEPRYDFMPAPPPRREPPMLSDVPEAAKPAPAGELRAVAILKSGVVDGMGYTLYVDGSIEAELPQGTLRFASINDLRSHLEKNS